MGAPSRAPLPGGDVTDFVHRRGAALVALARCLLPDPSGAEDVVADALSRALPRWRRIADTEDPEEHVLRSLVEACTSPWRRLPRRAGTRAAAGDADGPALPADDAGEDPLLPHLRRLPARQRSVLALRHVLGVDDERIAELLDVSPGAVAAGASRGMAALHRATAGADGPR